MSLPETADYATPFTSDDPVIEAGLDDPAYGDPETWPAWVDLDRWVAIPEAAQVSPTEDDCRWAAEYLVLPAPIAGGSPEAFEPSDADLDEMARWSAHLDRLEEIRRDDDHQAEARARFG